MLTIVRANRRHNETVLNSLETNESVLDDYGDICGRYISLFY
jgi:hypothetical protein